MNNPEPTEFSPEEKFLIHYYQTSQPGSFRARIYDITVCVASFTFALLFFFSGDASYGFVAYFMAFGYLLYFIIEGGRWGKHLRSIILKYEAKLQQLAEAKEKGQSS